MTRDEAKTYFEYKGLTYQDINEDDIARLVSLLKMELEHYLVNGGNHAERMGLSILKPRAKDVKILKTTGFQYAYLKIKSSYFEEREAISFEKSGVIELGRKLDSKNIVPIINAFCKWCDTLAC